jgi:hypothetical protein
MLKNDSTRKPPARQSHKPHFDEPIRRWSNLPVTQERACELVDLLTKYDDGDITDALIQLICGLMPTPTVRRQVYFRRAVSRGLGGSHARLHVHAACGQ